MLLVQIMTPEARERLNRIKLVKPQNYNTIRNDILKMASTGQITSKITEGKLKSIMDSSSLSQPKINKITILRKKIDDDDDDEDYMNDI